MKTALLSSLGFAIGLLASCSEPCNGHIESTVLYFAEAPNHQGQLVYINVSNKPNLGVKHTLMRDGKEFGTFNNVVVIEDPQNKFKGRRSICFDEFTVHKHPDTVLLDESELPQITLP
ncbi:MAG: hypothetical protein EOO60_04305 [Hymenobacter sp.]|nr:MAG: hypothetical protein EOO60_04305 [Hymenobacter sp.]